MLLCALRGIGLAHTRFADATYGTIRLKLLKLGALVRVSVRRIRVAMASACPWQDEFALAQPPVGLPVRAPHQGSEGSQGVRYREAQHLSAA